MSTEWQLPTRHIGRRVEVHEGIDSTNNRAAELAADAREHGTVILAEWQTAGRGQHGRIWQCPHGSGVLLSALLLPPAVLRRPALMTAWAAVAVCETIHEATGLTATIKWPNDVLVLGRKVCGILIEQGVGVVVGIGLNVNQSAELFAEQELPDAASLRTITGCTFDRDHIARRLIHHLDDGYDRLASGNTQTLESCWKYGIGLVGHRVRMDLTDGSQRLGHLRELAFAGVELLTDHGIERLQPEMIRHVRAAE